MSLHQDVNLILRVSTELRAAWQAHCKRLGVSQSDLLRKMMQYAMENPEFEFALRCAVPQFACWTPEEHRAYFALTADAPTPPPRKMPEQGFPWNDQPDLFNPTPTNTGE
jgi:hypothetical protein